MKKPNKFWMAAAHYPVAIPRMLCLIPIALIEILGILMIALGEAIQDAASRARESGIVSVKTPAELYVQMLKIEKDELERDRLLCNDLESVTRSLVAAIGMPWVMERMKGASEGNDVQVAVKSAVEALEKRKKRQ